jgi:myosin heavy subunit
VQDWLVKNKDPINESVEDLLKESDNAFMKKLWTEVSTTRIRGKGGQFRTVAALYKEQLATLMTTLNDTTPHFVRCIIPNHKKKAGEIDAPLVLHQLRCNGVLEGIRIVRQGFPSRVLFLDFKQRYSVLTPKSVGRAIEEGKVTVEKMLKELELDPADYRIGHTKVSFFFFFLV